MALNTDEMPLCCGIGCISGFEPIVDWGVLVPATGVRERKERELTVADVKAAINDLHKKCIFAALYHPQWAKYEPMLLECGFTMLSEFHNCNSGNRVRVYMLLQKRVAKRKNDHWGW